MSAEISRWLFSSKKGQTDHVLLMRGEPDQVLVQQTTKIVKRCFALNSVRFIEAFAGMAGHLVAVGGAQVGILLSQAVNRTAPCDRAEPVHQCSFF